MANLKMTRAHRRTKAQAFVEFAIIVPLLLLALTAIIEFGYAFYTWAAVGEVARIATRYAVTGEFDRSYCVQAGAALGLSADDLVDSFADCKVPSSVANYEAETNQLEDWARLPSIRDAGMNGGSVGLLFDPGVSGNYTSFLANPFVRNGLLANAGFHSDYRGDPTARGFISINVCSNRSNVAFDPLDHYYNGVVSNDTRYLGVCVVTDSTSTQYYMDDAGGPGDRIRVTVTYNHPLIIPFFSAMWPHLKLSTTQDAIVERFRTSRLAGLSGGISVLSTWTYTPLPPTETSTPQPPTASPTSTVTNTPSPTPQPCPSIAAGTGLRVNYYAYYGDANNNAFTNLVYSGLDPTVYHNWGSGSPNSSVPVDTFRGRWEGWVYPPYPGVYTFNTYSDDGVALWINGSQVISNWTDHGTTLNQGTFTLSCDKTPIKLEFYENGGGAVMQLGWFNGNIGTVMPIASQWLYPLETVPISTSTYVTLTPSRTPTSTNTYTPRPPTNTYTPRPPTNTFTPSNTFTATVPSLTYTQAPATNTPVPATATNTNTATRTNTPKPTCGISSDAGGCTPIP
jgi:hypothetical protein